MIEHYRDDIRVSIFRHWDGACQLAVPVDDNDDERIAVARLGEWSEYVDSDVFEWSGWRE